MYKILVKTRQSSKYFACFTSFYHHKTPGGRHYHYTHFMEEVINAQGCGFLPTSEQIVKWKSQD